MNGVGFVWFGWVGCFGVNCFWILGSVVVGLKVIRCVLRLVMVFGSVVWLVGGR